MMSLYAALLGEDVCAMNEDVYRHIRIAKNPNYEPPAPTEDTDEFTHDGFLLRQDMAFGKVRWYGIWHKDLWCYLRNNNPIFSTCFSHPLHPVSRVERLFLYSTIIIFKLSLSILVTRAGQCVEDGLTTCAIARSQETSFDVDTLELCCTSSELGMTFFMVHLGQRVGATVYSLLGGIVYAVSMFQFVACPCAQHHESEKRRHGLERTGYMVVGFVTVLVCCMAFRPLRYCIHNHMFAQAFHTFVVAQGLSWLGATLFIPGVGCFTFLNFKERKAEEAGKVKWHVTWQDYQEHCSVVNSESEHTQFI